MVQSTTTYSSPLAPPVSISMTGISTSTLNVGHWVKLNITIGRVYPAVDILASVNGRTYPTVQMPPKVNADGTRSLAAQFYYTIFGEPGSKIKFGYILADEVNGKTRWEKNYKTVTVKNP